MTATAEDVIAAAGSPQEARRAALGLMWSIGDLSYRHARLQMRVRAMLYNPAGPRTNIWLANRRAGKTRTFCGVADEIALAYPGIYIPYAAPTATQVRTFVDPHLTKLANEAPPDLAPEPKEGTWVFPPLQWYDADGRPVRARAAGGVEVRRFKGGKFEEKLRQSTINPRGCEDRKKADALRGPGTVVGIVDEMRDIPILDYVLTDVIGPMLWEAKSEWGQWALPKLIGGTTAPRRPDHPFVDVWERALARGGAIHSTIYESDHLTQEQIDEAMVECGGVDTAAWRREALAIIERDPRLAVFPEFDRARHVAEVPRPSHFLPCVIGDGGFIDQAFYGFGFYDFESARYVVEDELVFRRERSDAQDRAIAKREAELWPGVEVERRRVDSPPQVRADMNRAEWGREWSTEPDGPQPPHWLSVSKPRSRRAGSMESGVNRVRKLLAEGRLVIHPRCTTLIAHAEGSRWNTQRDSFVRVVDDDGEPLHHYDGAASLTYFCRDCNAHDNPIPQAPAGVGLPTHLIRKHLLRKTEDDKIRGLFGRKAGGR